MKYSQQVLDMLEKAVNGQIDNFWDFSFTFNALNDFELMIFLEEHDPSDKQGFIDFLTPYYEKAKQLANIERNIYMKLWKFNSTDVIITLKNGAVVRGFVEDYCDASDNDEEIDSLLVDVDGTLYEYFEDEIVSIIES